VRAVWDLMMAEVREYAGLHEYDGRAQDLSPAGLEGALARLGGGTNGAAKPEPDRHDEAHLTAFEEGVRTAFEVVEIHRWNPLVHLENLDLACYDRLYAPEEERAKALLEHARAWPDAIGASIESLDRIPADVATSLLPAIEGLADGLDGLPEDSEVAVEARRAHDALVEHLEKAVKEGPPDSTLGAGALTALLGVIEGMSVELGRLEEAADAERDRLRERLREDCERYRPGADPVTLLAELNADHPDSEGIYVAATTLIDELTAFTLGHDLLPELGGSCLVGPAPPSRRSAMAMMSWSAPYEDEAPACYYITPPDPSWELSRQEEWLSVFSTTTLPTITAHEVTPGHFAHGRMLCRADGEVRRSLFSAAFVEGWAHYSEELMVEEGFRDDDPRFAIGVWAGALTRVTRFAAALGVHGSTMSIEEAARRFEQDAMLAPAAALSEARRATYDPTYGRYTWGKLEIMALRDEARALWGKRYSHRRFHDALLALGSPPLGTIGDAIGD
jgi:hypothetical protein